MDIYTVLRERLDACPPGAPASETMDKILRVLFSPELPELDDVTAEKRDAPNRTNLGLDELQKARNGFFQANNRCCGPKLLPNLGKAGCPELFFPTHRRKNRQRCRVGTGHS